jgi:hypothetical protein
MRPGTDVGELMHERDRSLALLLRLEAEIAQCERSKHDLLVEIAEAEERGQWAHVAQLRTRAMSNSTVGT